LEEGPERTWGGQKRGDRNFTCGCAELCVEGAALVRVCKMKNTFIMVEGASFLEDSHVDEIKRECQRYGEVKTYTPISDVANKYKRICVAYSDKQDAEDALGNTVFPRVCLSTCVCSRVTFLASPLIMCGSHRRRGSRSGVV